MEINFDKDYLRQLYEEGKTTDKKHRFQPNIVARYQLRIKVLEQARSVEELYVIHSLHYEVLKGDKAGISSIRVNDQYRIEFTVEQVSSETVVTSAIYLNYQTIINRIIMGKYICQRPIHPGELLKEETEERKLSQRRLAEQMGISYKVLNDILNCRRPITTQTAMLFEAALGISASLLMRMQLDCNMQQAAADPSFMERLKQVRKYAAML